MRLVPMPSRASAEAPAGDRAAATLRPHVAVALAGLSLAVAGVIILLGIITAEALYPATYTTFDNEISDLGATRPPNSIIRQPSARIFNTTMLASGAFILASSAALFRSMPQRRMGIWVGLMGLGVFGVGVFPGNMSPWHGMFALLAFVAGGAGAVVCGFATRGPIRWASVGLGTIALGSLVVAMLGDLTPALEELGDGGVERWVAYPTVLWLTLFGGYLLGRSESVSV